MRKRSTTRSRKASLTGTSKRRSSSTGRSRKSSRKSTARNSTTRKKARSHVRKTRADFRSKARQPKKMASCSTVTGRIRAAERHRLPSWAFGLPELESYPVYRIDRDGKVHPDPEQAVTAKAYAKKELDKGYLTREQYKRIINKANHVLAHCKPHHRGRSRR